MPLKAGHSQEIVSGNIRDLMKTGKTQREAIAMALVEKRRSEKLDGTGDGSENVLADALSADAQNQALSDIAKQAILEKKKNRLFKQD